MRSRRLELAVVGIIIGILISGVTAMLGVSLGTPAAWASERVEIQPQAFFTSRFISPCSSSWTWLRSDSGSGYVCSSPGWTIEVPESQSIARVINDLEARIQALEGRIKQLEGQGSK